MPVINLEFIDCHHLARIDFFDRVRLGEGTLQYEVHHEQIDDFFVFLPYNHSLNDRLEINFHVLGHRIQDFEAI